MLDVVLQIAVLTLLLMFVDQVRRLVAHAILNRTIRMAMERDPGSVPILVSKLEPRRRIPSALVGLIMVVVGVAVGIAGYFEDVGERLATFQIAAIAIVLGVGTLAYGWVVENATPRE